MKLFIPIFILKNNLKRINKCEIELISYPYFLFSYFQVSLNYPKKNVIKLSLSFTSSKFFIVMFVK